MSWDGVARSVRSSGANYVLTESDDVFIALGSTDKTVTLPDPAGLLNSGTVPRGRVFTIRNGAASSTTTVLCAGSATIDGSTSLALAAGDKVTVITNGVNWFSI